MDHLKDQIAVLEAAIRSKKEALTELRRSMPRLRVEDYEFRGLDGHPIRLSECFGKHDELILIHNMGQGCNYCTLWADGLNGFVTQIQRRCAFVLASPDEPQAMREFAQSRGWAFPMVSVGGSSFNKDVGFYVEGEGIYPGFSTFKKNDDGTIDRISYDHFGPGDEYCGVWGMFALLDGGVGDWKPK